MDRCYSLGSGLESLNRIFGGEDASTSLERSRSLPRASSFSDLMLFAPGILSELPESVAFRESLLHTAPPHSSPLARAQSHNDDIGPLASPLPLSADTKTTSQFRSKGHHNTLNASPSVNQSVNMLEQFQERLGEEVCASITAAAASSGEFRSQNLTELLSNITTEIENNVRERLVALRTPLPPDITHYFHIVASHFGNAAAWAPENIGFAQSAAAKTSDKTAKTHDKNASPSLSSVATAQLLRIMPSFSRLWSHDAFPPVFALLLHVWLLGQPDDISYSVDVGNHFTVLINGANRLFWHDLLAGTRIYATVYAAVLAAVVHPTKLCDVPPRIRSEFHELTLRFFLYYEDPDTLALLLQQMPSMAEITDGADDASETSSFTSSRMAGDNVSSTVLSPSAKAAARKQRFSQNIAFFVHEQCRHIRGIRSEQGVIFYLQALASASANLPLDTHSSARLQSLLSTLATPGGPVYPTRKVRHAAQAAMDTIFPTGKLARRLVHICFRLLHPLTWPRSFIFWLQSVIVVLFGSCFRLCGCRSAIHLVGSLPILRSCSSALRAVCRRGVRPVPDSRQAATDPARPTSASPPAGDVDIRHERSRSGRVLLENESTVRVTGDDENLGVWEYVTSSYSVSVLVSTADYICGKIISYIPFVPLERIVSAAQAVLRRKQQ